MRVFKWQLREPWRTALHAAVADNNLGLVERLCEGCSTCLNVANGVGRTPLHVALTLPWESQQEHVGLLLRAEADVNIPDAFGFTPIALALRSAQVGRGGGSVGTLALLFKASPSDFIDHVLCERVVDPKWDETLLHAALKQAWEAPERHRLVASLCSRGANVNMQDWLGRTPLHIAIDHAGHDLWAIVSTLIQAGAVADAGSDSGRALAQDATSNPSVDTSVLQLLLPVDPWHFFEALALQQAGPSELRRAEELVDSLDMNQGFVAATGQTALHLLLQVKHPAPCRDFLCARLLSRPDVDASVTDREGRSALHFLWARGTCPSRRSRDRRAKRFVKLLLKARASVNATDYARVSPLHIAAQLSSWGVLAQLVRMAGDVNARDANGRTPAQVAVHRDTAVHLSVLQLLLEAGAQDVMDVLLQRHPGPLSQLEELVDIVDVNRVAVSATRQTLLHVVLQRGFWQQEKLIAKLLLRPGVDANAADSAGRTALHLMLTRVAVNCCGRERKPAKPLLRLLLGARAAANAVDCAGDAPLHIAVRQSSWSAVTQLVQHRGDVNIEDATGCTPVRLALKHSHPPFTIFHMLLTGLHDINSVVGSAHGETLLHTSVRSGTDSELVTLLLRAKACVNQQDGHGCSALHTSLESITPYSFVSALVEAGADVNMESEKGQTPCRLAVDQPVAHMQTLLLLLRHADHDGQQLLLDKLFQLQDHWHHERCELRKERNQLKRSRVKLRRNLQELQDLIHADTRLIEQLQRTEGDLRRNVQELEKEKHDLAEDLHVLEEDQDEMVKLIQQLQKGNSDLQARMQQYNIEFDVASSVQATLDVAPSVQAFGNRREHFFREAESQFLRELTRGSALAVRSVKLNLNGPLWQRYRQRRHHHPPGPCQEQWGFHGTDETSLQAIIQDGFEIGGEGVRMRNGAAGGRGVYLANSPKLSMDFAAGRKMIMARFYVNGAAQHRDAWVIAHKADVYPQYVISF